MVIGRQDHALVETHGTVLGLSGTTIVHDAVATVDSLGGPVVDGDGTVVGMNTTKSCADAGQGSTQEWTVTSDALRESLSVLESGRAGIASPSLGIVFAPSPVTLTTAQRSKMTLSSSGYGAVIEGIRPGYGAAVAGLRVGDVVVAFNDKAVDDANQISGILATLPVGSAATLMLFRGDILYMARIVLVEQR